jgi:hypothetical protein
MQSTHCPDLGPCHSNVIYTGERVRKYGSGASKLHVGPEEHFVHCPRSRSQQAPGTVSVEAAHVMCSVTSRCRGLVPCTVVSFPCPETMVYLASTCRSSRSRGTGARARDTHRGPTSQPPTHHPPVNFYLHRQQPHVTLAPTPSTNPNNHQTPQCSEVRTRRRRAAETSRAS